MRVLVKCSVCKKSQWRHYCGITVTKCSLHEKGTDRGKTGQRSDYWLTGLTSKASKAEKVTTK